MTGFESKRQVAKAKMNDEADTLTIVYQRGFADGKRAAQPEQEPVAWFSSSGTLYRTRFHAAANGEQLLTPLYTTPPQRPWVGLEAEEILDLFDRNNVYGSKWIEFARTVEAKLKERNNGP
jgi:hypothetical protein